MPEKIYLSSYQPLIIRKDGRIAQAKYNLPPFVDASCRREPDLEHECPSISALCHANMFAPRLYEGNTVIFITVKGMYLGEAKTHWRLTAILKVVKRCSNHAEAAEWYRTRGLPLPSNCLVRGNPPMPLDMTIGHFRGKDKRMQKAERVEEWDVHYQARARKCGIFLVCKPLFRELHRPPMLTTEDAERVFVNGKMPVTRTPPEISEGEFARLKHACGIP